jgi:hypothetical protein
MGLGQGHWTPLGLLLDSAYMYGGGAAGLKDTLLGGEQNPWLKPMKINTKSGLNSLQRSSFANLVNTKPIFKGAGKMNNNTHLSIAKKFREKRAGADPKNLGLISTILKDWVRPGMQTALYGLGAGVLGNTLYEKHQDSKRSEQAYKEMFERFPELNELESNKIDDYWGLMNQYAPSMTRNPLVAGQFIKNMADYNLRGVDFPTLKSILDVEAAASKKQQDALSMIVKGIGGGIA